MKRSSIDTAGIEGILYRNSRASTRSDTGGAFGSSRPSLQALEAARNIAVVPRTDRDAAITGPPRALAERIYRNLPLCVWSSVRSLVAGERADPGGPPRACAMLAELKVADLHLARRNVAVLQVGGEVGITGNTGQAQPGLNLCVPIQHRKVRALCHQNRAVLARDQRPWR